jgi:hypothetical protein
VIFPPHLTASHPVLRLLSEHLVRILDRLMQRFPFFRLRLLLRLIFRPQLLPHLDRFVEQVLSSENEPGCGVSGGFSSDVAGGGRGGEDTRRRVGKAQSDGAADGRYRRGGRRSWCGFRRRRGVVEEPEMRRVKARNVLAPELAKKASVAVERVVHR